MAVYFCMLLATVGLAACAMFFPAERRVLLAHAGRVITIRQRRILIALSFLPMFLVSALRYRVGVDYMSYTYIFDALNSGGSAHTEWGYSFLNLAVGFFTGNAQWLYAVVAAITLALLFYGVFRFSPDPALSLFLFVTMGYLFSSFNILRQYVSIALVFASLRLIERRRFVPFVLVVLAAASFHKTAVIMLPLYFLLHLRLKQSYMLMLTLFGCGMIALRGPLTTLLVNTFYPQYAGTQLIRPLSTFEFLYYAAVFGILILLCLRYREAFFSCTLNLILFNAVFYSFLMYLCLSFVPEINRIAVYIELFVILLIPRLFACEQNRRVRRFYYLVTVLAFLGFFVLTIGIQGRFQVVPYTSVFFDSP